MDFRTIKAPEGVRQLMVELWANHMGGSLRKGNVFFVDLPEPTEEEKRRMAENRADRKPFIPDENQLNDSLMRALETLGGW